ncbi:uncharacterized protein LOC114286086 [Camellia sinensis]|uniref:uncharacterized protein LOC114286086 n=1 Tax=Camellia sinensis TaxID=4442 RepID=UPI0010360EA4|nr:uncharacterized protein LOC114286086 [Camellia sinensis]
MKEQINLLPHFDEMNNDLEEDEDDVAFEIHRPCGPSGKSLPSNQNSSFAGSKRLKTKGPMDVFYTPNPNFVVQNKKGKQTTIDHNDPYNEKLIDRAMMRITRWIYDASIAFNAVSYDSFGPMVEAVGQYGPSMKPPSFHEVQVPYLKKELSHTNELMRIQKEEWVKYGCSLMSDGWTSQSGRTLINFLVNCPRGTMFVESINASSYSKDGEKLLESLDKFVDDVGEVNIVQIIIDSASTNVLAGKFLEAKRPHLFWTPCIAHCLDLILEDIFKLPHMKKTFDRAIRVHSYFYNRPGVLNMMRIFKQLKNLVKLANTRFATTFLTLSRIHQQKNSLRKMFTSKEWTSFKWAKEPKGKQATQIMLMSSFWNLVVYALKVSGSLVHVLRLVDYEKKPAMGYIYEAMDRAKESIAKSFNEKEEKYKNIFEIIDNG